MDSKLEEKQYIKHINEVSIRGKVSLGFMQSGSWYKDPKHLLFTLSRYKFVAKMLSGKTKVLEIGCCDGFFSSIVTQEVEHVHGIDIDQIFIDEARQNINNNFSCSLYNIMDAPMPSKYDAAYALDVLEHIKIHQEDIFLTNICNSLNSDGELIIGMPSIESQIYASNISKAGHFNCKSGLDLKKVMKKYFKHVFLFSMNDEVIHTGYIHLAHYLIAVCAGII
jgi:2-polyprenyl-3-methyl-5-hydroxy-6-metoxy-1,4-benzoquinol methylase